MSYEPTKVTQEQAEAVLAEIKEKYASYIPGWNEPVIRRGNWGRSDNDRFSIDWEEGPESWALQFHSNVEGVYTEPYNSFAVMVCIADFTTPGASK